MLKEVQAARARVAQRMAMENYLRCFTRHEFDWLRVVGVLVEQLRWLNVFLFSGEVGAGYIEDLLEGN
jgi:hypothetical protein